MPKYNNEYYTLIQYEFFENYMRVNYLNETIIKLREREKRISEHMNNLLPDFPDDIFVNPDSFVKYSADSDVIIKTKLFKTLQNHIHKNRLIEKQLKNELYYTYGKNI